MEIILIIGRILFGGYFFMMGVNHFTKKTAMVEYAQSKKLPSPKMSVASSGLLLILAGLGVAFNTYTQTSLLMLVVFLIPTSFLIHGFWKESDPNMKMVDMQHFLKNMALIGAVLMLYAINTGL